ncbi:hypothetical protein PROFUN_15157 [Planoprotostelium fungivorum]|uniref:ABC transporter domain-containing protein n=1 Tax=Planoprotostelium fungivorum TaxID=1890364 RepID=A0A2P6MXQ2_9EUKA|nr:hypothetical protein PROFUN_15157 [Planoprotostelium fungivorum]
MVEGAFVLSTEAHDDDGCPHVLEHLIFMGSELYSYKGVLDSLANRCFASGTNAWTAVDHTAYTIETAGAEGFLNLLPIYLDHILYPTITDSAFHTEVHHVTGEGENAGVVYCEMQGRENTGSSLMNRRIHQLLFPGECGYSSETGGILENLRSLKVDKVRKYHADYYRPDNLCLVITGKITAEEICTRLLQTEERILSKGALPTMVKPWTTTPIRELEKSIVEQIQFPSEDEDDGYVSMVWIGPKEEDLFTTTALGMLWKYFTDTSVSDFQRVREQANFVEMEDPIASDVDSLAESYTNYIHMVQKGINMKRMSDLLNKAILEEENDVEESASSNIQNTLIRHILYAKEDASLSEYMNEKDRIKKLLDKPQAYWTQLAKTYILDKPYVCVEGHPSKKLAKSMVVEEKKRIEAQRKTLGEERLNQLSNDLEKANQENSREIPREILTQLPIPSVEKIPFIPIATVRNDKLISEEGREIMEEIQKTKNGRKSRPISFFTQFDHVKSSFVSIMLTADTSVLDDDLRSYLELYIETVFESPIKRKGAIIGHEQVVEELLRDTITYSIGLGYGHSTFSCGVFSQMLMIEIKVEISKYRLGIHWLQELIWQSVFNVKRLKIFVAKMLSDMPSLKRKGKRHNHRGFTSTGTKLSHSIMYDDNFDPVKSNHGTMIFIKQEAFLKKVQLLLKNQKTSGQVIDALNHLRKTIFKRDNIRIQVVGDMTKIKNVKSTWIDHFSSGRSQPKEKVVWKEDIQYASELHRIHSKVTEIDEKRGYIYASGAIETGYLSRSVPSITSFTDPDWAPLLVAIEYLTALEGKAFLLPHLTITGPFWKKIRGLGLSYGYSVDASVEDGLLYFSLTKSTDIPKAYSAAAQIVQDIVDGREAIHQVSLECARSTVICATVQREQTMEAAAVQSFFHHLRGAPQDYNRTLLRQVQHVTQDDIQRVINKYIAPLFQLSSGNTVIVLNPVKLKETSDSFSKMNAPLQLIESLDLHFASEKGHPCEINSELLNPRTQFLSEPEVRGRCIRYQALDANALGRDFLQPLPLNPEGDAEQEVNVAESVKNFQDAADDIADNINSLRTSGLNHSGVKKSGLKTSGLRSLKTSGLRSSRGEHEEIDMRDLSSVQDVDLEKAQLPDGDFDIKKWFEDSVRNRLAEGGHVKKMGVVAKNLTVVGQGAAGTTIPDNLSPLFGLLKLFWIPSWFKKNSATEFNILNNVSAFCKEGEMLLVLGRPGAGCSTFLRVVANERKNFVRIEGDLTYGGIPADEFKRYLGEAIYAPEEDAHFPTLTVRQTLDFALRMKTPGKLGPISNRKTFRQVASDLLTKMFGLTKQYDTMVGNEWIRGLSGGERKRMTITEAMVSSSPINCWDCSTRGLDSASALDYAKSLRVMSDVLHKTTVGTFYQASESIYQLFDRVLVLEKGRCIYFGPCSEAKEYFMDLGFDCEPRKTTPDFLTGVTNPQERKIRPGYEDKAPLDPDALEARWLQSEAKKKADRALQEAVDQIEHDQPAKEFVQEVKEMKGKRTRKRSVYNVSILSQASGLVKRQAELIWGNKFGLISRYVSVVIQALIYGSVFLNLPTDTSGAFTRGGAIFAAILQNSFMAQAELPATFFGRAVLQKQKSYAMYHPSAFHIAQVILDVPICLLQVILFSVITYWMYGLQAEAGKFFIYMFTLFITSMCLTAFFRTLGNLSPSLFLSQQAMGIFLILLLVYCGYFIPYYQMRPWLIWVHWINPLGYAFKGLYLNEMNGLIFDCTTTGHLPAGPEYTDPAYRVCALPGSVAGQTQTDGRVYVQTALDFNTDQMSIDIAAVCFLWIFFVAVNCLAVEYLQWTSGGFTRKVYKGGKAPRENQIEDADRKDISPSSGELERVMTMSGSVFMWKDIQYTVPVKGGKRLLLDHVSGWIKPGQMTALMGSSGAGKTTLLDVLAQRKTQGKVEGTMLLDGSPLKRDFERITGYVEQMDVHNGFVTVREALRFSAKLRQESDISVEDKYQYVEKVLHMMEMSSLGECLIGSLDTGIGISVEERKRLTIGMELVARPHILFLDEPTSGLDAQSSYNIIKFCRKLADAGMPLVCTIHQPSSVLFEHFDRLLLLARGGKTVYFGDIGTKSSTLTGYFEKNGVRKCLEEENPAEYILEAIGAGVSGSTTKDWPVIWNDSPEHKGVQDELDRLSEARKADSGEKAKEFATSTWYQFVQLYIRMNVVFWRSPNYNAGRIIQAIAVGLIVGFSYWDLGNSTSDLQQRVLAIFQILILGIMLIVAAQPQFMMLRELFKRDYSSKFYSWFPFSLSMIVVEIPYLTLAATLCVVCCYWSVGLDSTPLNGFYFWIAFVVFMYMVVAFGQLIASMSPNVGLAMLILPIFNTFLFLFSGVLAPPSTLPYFWRSWCVSVALSLFLIRLRMYPLDPFHYFLEGVLTTVLQPLTIVCSERDLHTYNVPPGQTCGSYSAAFLSRTTGYVVDPASTTTCSYCQYSTGEDYYNTLEWSIDHRWRNFGLLWCYWAFNILAGAFFVWLFRKQSR